MHMYRLDDPCWQAAPWTEPFLDIEGPSKPPPWHQTRVKMLWDDECLYIAAWLDEPQPWATLTQHDSVIYKVCDCGHTEMDEHELWRCILSLRSCLKAIWVRQQLAKSHLLLNALGAGASWPSSNADLVFYQ